jgi:hypothetical protein
MFFLHRIWNWCSRFRHRCGYGVHSPSDFFLITSVVYEKYHYYAYRVLKERGFPAYLPPTNDVVPLSPVLVYIMLFFMVPVIKNLQYNAVYISLYQKRPTLCHTNQK